MTKEMKNLRDVISLGKNHHNWKARWERNRVGQSLLIIQRCDDSDVFSFNKSEQTVPAWNSLVEIAKEVFEI